MNEKEIKRISKFLSLLLRHQPETIGLNLDENGWADVEELIDKSKKRRMHFSISDLEKVVAENDKQRFSFNEDKSKIRANQGHSIKNVNLEFEAIEPPENLYHGTVEKFLESIKTNGLQKMNRQHVHLSEDVITATKVGSRRGKPIILVINSGWMFREGYEFYKSKNGVWLTDQVPSKFIQFKN
ncbi:RNA 2'-phosphotransferase [Tenacibaculum sp. SZ-18]|uniref:RNA 2'-phosphotransferase n=1 Tax=Tenacibaculum sp. SZ-18 TaxID=754423 RepID=UPI000C2CE95C|nr:RNA 2'-phosphotransferase [Tenacibaculum sp. SZ-18]AUC15158.1 RNA 2'-phosphotransferase [Tenacibaculum sp. SZ-18]